jgi:glycosyltransferase involved in cell wall biosynthesis
MRLLLVTDAWYPQVNGVVRTLAMVLAVLDREGHRIEVLSPQNFTTLPCPTYPEIRLSLFPSRRVEEALEQFGAEAVHIATEGPLGIAARRICIKRDLPFTTSFHTRFPEYVQQRFKVPVDWTFAWLRRFHNAGAGVMVSTETLANELQERGFTNVMQWSRGVDTDLFHPRPKDFLDHLPRPIWLNVGRVSVEKNIEAFLKLPLEGTKLVVGDGPKLAELKRKYPETIFVGAKQGEELAQYYAAADVFVFPSRTDTFGLVVLEALASGLPVAAYPVPGPMDVINGSGTGALDPDLYMACQHALTISSKRCSDYASGFSWQACAFQFLENLRPFERNSAPVAGACVEG